LRALPLQNFNGKFLNRTLNKRLTITDVLYKKEHNHEDERDEKDHKITMETAMKTDCATMTFTLIMMKLVIRIKM
jgi:hypothetical protein